MEVIKTKLAGVLVVEPAVFRDERGSFRESYHKQRYADLVGSATEFVQDNHSTSHKGVLRGLHLQVARPQGKLVRVVRGHVWDVAVDVDPRSATFKQWVGFDLTEENERQFYIPPGYAHGFCVLSESADLLYKCSQYYDPRDEVGILWNDSELAIDWPVRAPALSARDAGGMTLNDFLRRR
jgi:dTDP-4-dehydrorhamnose 3,5-epimerase